jgi:hypothetical protein
LEEIGPLRHCCADEEAAVGTALDRELGRGRPALRDEVLRSGVEVVEDEEATFLARASTAAAFDSKSAAVLPLLAAVVLLVSSLK